MVKYSIIIPCYNSAKFIKDCIRRLLNLKYNSNRFEILFVDDCSSDNTVKYIREMLSDCKIAFRIIENTVNLGPGLSRRRAAEEAHGEYLCFCDSDDWFAPDILNDLDNEIYRENSDLVIFDMSYVLKGKCIPKNYTTYFEYGNKMSYLANCMESLCNLAVRRSLFLSIPSIDIRNGEDLALVPLLIAKARSITHINKPYYNYLMRNDSASLSKPSKSAYRNMLLAYDHIRKNIKIKNKDIADCLELIGIKTVLYNATLMAIKGGNNNNVLNQIVSNFTNVYPSWDYKLNNESLNATKRLYLCFIKNKCWFFCRIFAKIHTFIFTSRI